MSIRKAAVAALVAASVVAVPAVAQVATANQAVASKLSVGSAVATRKGAKLSKKNNVGPGVIIAVIAVAGVVGGAVISADGASNPPTSP